MPVFQFKARNSAGHSVEDYIEAADRQVAVDQLRSRGLFVLEITQRGEASTTTWFKSLFQKVPARDIVAFTRELSVMTSATIPLVQALRTLVHQSANVQLKIVASRLADEVNGGARLSQAMALFPHVFDTFFVNMIRSGEVSGRLDETLSYLADQQEKDYDLMTRIRGAMIYPAFVVSGIIIVGFIMMVFVLPKITEMMGQMGGQLPLPTRMLIAVSDFMSAFWYAIVLVVLAIGIGLRIAIQTPHGRAYWDGMKLRLPAFGILVQRIYLVRLARGLSTLLSAGIPLTQALSVSAETVGNHEYATLLRKTMGVVEEGRSVTSVLAQSKVVPAMVHQMMAVGEQTGQLDAVLSKVALFYEREVDVLIQNLIRLIEPVIIVILGVGVAIIVAAVILPIFNIATQI